MPAVSHRYTPEELQRQYSARAAVPEHPQIFQRWAQESEAFRAQVKCELNISYGEREREKLDLFLPDAANAPTLIFIHGGYWQAMGKDDFSFLAREFVRRGVAVAVPGYELCPAVTLDEIFGQICAAIMWVRANAGGFNLAGERLHLSGHSAGGQLTAMALSSRWAEFVPERPQCPALSGFSLSGVFDLAPLIHTQMNAALVLDHDSARRNSPMFSTPATDAPLTLAVGGLESAEFHRQSREMAEIWAGRGVNTRVMAAQGCHHFSLLDEFADAGSELFATAIGLVDVAAGKRQGPA